MANQQPAPIQTPLVFAETLLITLPWVQYLQWLAEQSGGGGGGGATVYAVTLTADTTISLTAPVAAGDILFVDIAQNGTGGWNITWGATARGGPTELGNTSANTRYLVGFTGIDIGGTLTWVKFSEQLSY